MALTANRNVDRFVDQELRSFRVKSATHVFKNALVGLTAAGYARGLVAGDAFCGVAYEECDNTGADGAKVCRVYTQSDFEHTLTGAVQADVGRPVFASADDTLTFLADGNSFVGWVQDLVANDTVIVRIDPFRRLVSTVSYAVEQLAAGADIAARAIHHFAGEGWIVAARVVAQGSAAGIDGSNTCVVTVGINAGSVASKTYNGAPAFPAANTKDSLGTLTNVHANAGDILTLAVTNGATADPPLFLVEVDYL